MAAKVFIPPLKAFQQKAGPTLRAFLRYGLIPQGKLALRIVAATIEHSPLLGSFGGKITWAIALRAGNTGGYGFGEAALGIIATG